MRGDVICTATGHRLYILPSSQVISTHIDDFFEGKMEPICQVMQEASFVALTELPYSRQQFSRSS